MRQGKFDNVVFKAARSLMNTATAPQALSTSFAQAVVNMIPTKGGTLAIRNGTLAIGSPTGDGNIIEIMPFIKSDGTSQTLVYTDGGKIKTFNEGAGTYADVKTGLDPAGFPVYDYFNQGGSPYLVIVNGIDPNMTWDGTTISTMSEYVSDAGASKTWVSATQASMNTGVSGATNYPNGRSVKVTFSTNAHLNATTLTRVGTTATFTCTVAHNLLTGDYVTITNANEAAYNGTFQITVTSPTVFTYQVVGSPATPATGSVQLDFTAITRTTTVSSTSVSGQVLTITFAGSILPAASVTISNISFQTSPTPFSFIFSAQGRLWAIPAGQTLPTTYKDNTKRGFIYYTTSIGVINSWFSPVTLEMAYFDVSNNMPLVDEIIAINEYNEFMIFLGRNGFQAWKGTDPSDVNNWGFAQSIPVGLVHPKLVQRLPNDLAMITPYGARTLRVAIQNQALESSGDVGSAVDPSFAKEIAALTASTAAYQSARSFYYPSQGIYGFKLPNKTMVFEVQAESKGWVEWTGDFTTADAFAATADSRLLMADGQQLMRYADGNTTTTKAYSDRGEAIRWVWWTPWVGGTRRWANHAFEVIHNDSTANTFEVVRLKDNSLGFQSSNTLTVARSMGLWDSGLWDNALWDASLTPIPRVRDKFLAQTMSFVVRGNTTEGPLEIVSLTCFGQWER